MKNVEIKARSNPEQHALVTQFLMERNATFMGEDHQIDTYFNVPAGRLKLREGNIENALVQYHRPNEEGPKVSRFVVAHVNRDSPIKEALTNSLGVLAVVDKKRKIFYYFHNNIEIKIHLDVVKDLGMFMEIEVKDEDESLTVDRLRGECEYLMKAFGVKDLVSDSYSDMILGKT